MKRVYERPAVYVEAVQLDKPIAVGCSVDSDDINSLIQLGYFGTNEFGCTIKNDNPDYDTVCYHSNVIKALTS